MKKHNTLFFLSITVVAVGCFVFSLFNQGPDLRQEQKVDRAPAYSPSTSFNRVQNKAQSPYRVQPDIFEGIDGNKKLTAIQFKEFIKHRKEQQRKIAGLPLLKINKTNYVIRNDMDFIDEGHYSRNLGPIVYRMGSVVFYKTDKMNIKNLSELKISQNKSRLVVEDPVNHRFGIVTGTIIAGYRPGTDLEDLAERHQLSIKHINERISVVFFSPPHERDLISIVAGLSTDKKITNAQIEIIDHQSEIN